MFVCNRAYLELLENYIFLRLSMCPSTKSERFRGISRPLSMQKSTQQINFLLLKRARSKKYVNYTCTCTRKMPSLVVPSSSFSSFHSCASVTTNRRKNASPAAATRGAFGKHTTQVRKKNIFVDRRHLFPRAGHRARRVASSFDEPTRKLDIDDDATTENGGDEPNVFDLMSATMVPYEKTYRLCFLRHAKSSYSQWAYSSGDATNAIENDENDDKDNFDLPDKYRSIAPRGKLGAEAVAKTMVTEHPEFVPSIIITSDATRCLDTVECFSMAEPEAFGKTTVILAPEFYEVAHGSDVKAKRLRKAITKKIKREAQMRSAETVCVVGHNTGWENVVKLLTKSSKKVRMKTSNCALLSCKAGEMTWEEALMEGEWELEKILRVPKELNRKAKMEHPEEDSGNWIEDDNEAEEDEDEEVVDISFE